MKKQKKSKMMFDGFYHKNSDQLDTTYNKQKNDIVAFNKKEKGNDNKIVICQLTAYNTIKVIADELIKNKVVYIDLSKLSRTDRIRSIDFICGVMYSLQGTYKKISEQIYRFNC